MLSFLEGGGPSAKAIRSHDWSGSPLGPPEMWPAVLKTTVGVVIGSRFPQCIVWGPSLITIPNDAFLPILGEKAAALGRPFSDVWEEVWPSLAPIVAKAFAGEATYIEDFALTIDRHGYPEEAFFTFCYSPIRDEYGKVVGMLDTVCETTSKVELVERHRLLAGELGHRMKNLLSIVQAVAGQTLRQAADLKSANEALGFRLAALAGATDMLTASQWTSADLHTLADRALGAHNGNSGRISIDGPEVEFNPHVTLALTLTFHELVTNATKYGALSNDKGRINLQWSIFPDEKAGQRRFRLVWRETDGPTVENPTRRGFGSMMIERSLRAYFHGDISIEYDSCGVVFTIDAPLTTAIMKGE